MLSQASKTESVLLVDDDPFCNLAIRKMLRRRGSTHLRWYRNGHDALAYLCRSEAGDMPGCVLLDLNMPGLSGIEVLRRIRRQPALRGLTIFILSNSTNELEHDAAISLGASCVFVKPERDEDYEVIGECMGREMSRRSKNLAA